MTLKMKRGGMKHSKALKMNIQPKGFLVEASLLYKEQCPELSRFLMQEAHQVEDLQKSYKDDSKHQASFQQLEMCQHCGLQFQPGNHRVRLRPKRRPSARVQGVLRREAGGKRLSLAQKELLRRFRGSSSGLMATCHSCNKTSRYNGVNRDLLRTVSTSHSTPGSTGKHRSPQALNRSNPSTPKSVGKNKTPSNTPRSVSSNTPGSSSKSPSGIKKWAIQSLSKILIRDHKQDSKGGRLKDFLSSL